MDGLSTAAKYPMRFMTLCQGFMLVFIQGHEGTSELLSRASATKKVQM